MSKKRPDEDSAEPRGELVPATPQPGSLQERFIQQPGDYWCSFPIATIQDKAKLQKALVTQDVKIDEVAGMSWQTVDLVAQRIQLMSEEDGELKDATRLVLIDDKGKMVSTVSEGAVTSMRAIIATFGRPPWQPPLKLVFDRKKTRKGFFTYVVWVETFSGSDK